MSKCFDLRTFLCELESCRDFMGIATRSENPGKECHHLERTRNAQVYSPLPPLHNDTAGDGWKRPHFQVMAGGLYGFKKKKGIFGRSRLCFPCFLRGVWTF